MKFKRKTRKGFSLIELLVATTIFALALVIAFGAFTLTLGNQSFVQANADVNTEGDRIARQLSDDIINANGVGAATVGLTTYDNIKSLIFLNNDGYIIGSGIGGYGNGICYYREQTSCDRTANTLILYYKNPDKVKVYYWDHIHGNLWSKSNNDSSILITDFNTFRLSITDRVNSDKVEVNRFSLTGATCSSAQCNQQPFAGIDLGVRTKSYDSKPPAKRAKFYIQTRVESRIQ